MSKLQNYRKQVGLSQSQLANLACVNISLLQKYETGERSINKAQAGTILKLAKALNVPIEDLLEDNEEE